MSPLRHTPEPETLHCVCRDAGEATGDAVTVQTPSFSIQCVSPSTGTLEFFYMNMLLPCLSLIVCFLVVWYDRSLGFASSIRAARLHPEQRQRQRQRSFTQGTMHAFRAQGPCRVSRAFVKDSLAFVFFSCPLESGWQLMDRRTSLAHRWRLRADRQRQPATPRRLTTGQGLIRC